MAYLIDTVGERSGRAIGRVAERPSCSSAAAAPAGFSPKRSVGCSSDVRSRLYLVDPDRVEPHNVARQAFDRRDVGRFKSEVLAERLARRFEREVGYSVLPYDRELHARVFGDAPATSACVVGCVDNAAARRAIAATLDVPTWSTSRARTSAGGSIAATVATPARYFSATRRGPRRCAARSSLPNGDAGRCQPRASSAPTC